MVLEQLYSVGWIEKKTRYAFLMGIGYSILGIIAAMFIFPQDPGIAAIAFTSLLILPSLTKLISIEANQAAREKKFSLRQLIWEHGDIFKIYVFLFLGILLAFAFFSIVWPHLATSSIFSQQASIFGTLATGKATAAASAGAFFWGLLKNNLLVLVICLVLSLIYGTGAIFILTWNASVWGVVFGLMAKNSAVVAGANPFWIFALTFIAVFPHLVLEALSYIIAAVSGGVISKAVIREKVFSNRFNQIVQDGLMLFVLALIVLFVAAYIEVFVTGFVVSLFGVL
jgi:uncharacterized membrane protein SpoIIM required for sporulation